jgi:DNA-binding winged helix-turn-helix (wHTH) protein/predicted ATPase
MSPVLPGGDPVHFAPFVLSPDEGRLRSGGDVVPLRPRSLAVLHYLALRPGRLVTKEELFAAVWPGVVVSDVVLAVCVSELRKALGDTAKTPRYIETVHGRGYRFVAKVHCNGDGAWPSPDPDVGGVAPMVGRDAELDALAGCLATALAGRRQVVSLAGDPGMGKTTLVEAFLERTAARGALWCARGQCIEQHGPGEPFMPVLEALGRLCRQPAGVALVPLLREHAPTWLLQLPGLISPGEREALQRQYAGVTRARMLREMVVSLEALTTRTPMVLVLEDLHWSDPSTLDLLVALAQRREPARLLVIATYRGPEANTNAHARDAIGRILDVRATSRLVTLGPLTPPATDAYVQARFPGRRLPPGFADALHRRTGGHPLFMVHVADRFAADGKGVPATTDVAVFFAEVPESLSRTLEHQLERLATHERRALEAASGAGVEFTAAEVAAGLREDVELVDTWCAELAQRGQFVRVAGASEWPDGTATGRYEFTHALYRDVLEQRASESVRRRLHQRIGERLEAGYGARASEIAPSLAAHFARSGDHARALVYHRDAGEHAAERNAFAEAIAHFRAALQALARCPGREGSVRDELRLHVALGATLSQVQGFAAPEVGDVYARALALCEHIGNVPERFVVVGGLEAYYSIRGELPTASPLARQLLQLGERSADRMQLMEGCHAMGCNRLRVPELRAAQDFLERAVALYDLDPQTDAYRHSGHDPKVCCLGHLACVLWLGGHLEQARARAEATLALAETLAHPPSLALALSLATWLEVLARDPGRVDVLSARSLGLAREYGFTFYEAIASVHRGWALAQLGAGSDAAALLHRGIGTYVAIGAGTLEAGYRMLGADGYGRLGRFDEAEAELAKAFEALERHGERHLEAELHRTRGELLLAREPSAPVAEAEQAFRAAITVARRQNAASLELRAATDLVRLLARSPAPRTEALAALREAYDRFAEGIDTPDVREAAALLRVSGASPGRSSAMV